MNGLECYFCKDHTSGHYLRYLKNGRSVYMCATHQKRGSKEPVKK